MFQGNDETNQKAIWPKSLPTFRKYRQFFVSLILSLVAILMVQNSVHSSDLSDQSAVGDQNFDNQSPCPKSHGKPYEYLDLTTGKVSCIQTIEPMTRQQKRQRFYEEGIRLFACRYWENFQIPAESVNIVIDESIIPNDIKSTTIFVVFFKKLRNPQNSSNRNLFDILNKKNESSKHVAPPLFLKVISESEKKTHQKLENFLLYYNSIHDVRDLLLFPMGLVQIQRPQWLDTETYKSFWTLLHVFPYYQDDDFSSFFEKNINVTLPKPLRNPLETAFYDWGKVLAKLHNFGAPRLNGDNIQTLLTHGDLHANNILRVGYKWMIIDFETLGLCNVINKFTKRFSGKTSDGEALPKKIAVTDLDATYYDSYLDINDTFSAMNLESVFSYNPIMRGGDYLSNFVNGYCQNISLTNCSSSADSPLKTIFTKYVYLYLGVIHENMKQSIYFSIRKQNPDDFLTDSERLSILACFADESAGLSMIYQNALKKHESFQ